METVRIRAGGRLMLLDDPRIKLRGVPDPNALQMLPPAVDPTARPPRPGLLARIGHGAARALFPVSSAYQGLLSDQDQNALQSQGLLQAGLNVLAQPGGTSPLQALGRGVQGVNWQDMLSQHAETLASLNNYKKQQARESQRQQIIDKYPMPAGESPVQMGARLMRMLPEFVRIGDMEMVGKLTELLKSMQLGSGSQEQGTPHPGVNPTTQQPDQYLTDRNGNIRWLGIAPVVDQNAKAAVDLQREGQRATPLVTHYDAETKDLRTAHLFGKQGLQQAQRAIAGDPAAQYTLFHAFLKLNDPQAVVRPGTAELVSHASSFYQKVRAWEQGYLEGKSRLMDPSFTRQIARVTAEQVEDLERRWNDEYNTTVRRATRLKLNPEDYFTPPDLTPREFMDPWLGGSGDVKPGSATSRLRGRP